MGENLRILINYSYGSNCPFRPAKSGQVREVFFEIADFFVLDMCSNPIFCSKIAHKDKKIARGCYNLKKLLKS